MHFTTVTMNSVNNTRRTLGWRAAILVIAALLVAAVASAQDERGKQLYANCVACHGPEGLGNKLLNAPSIAGLSEKYVTEQLKKFKSGVRGGDVNDTTGLQMVPMAMILATEEDIAAVSAYVSEMKSKPQEATIAGGDAEKGKTLYATCLACHGVDGKGNDLLNSPALINQYDWYLALQLQKFKSGIRGSNPQDTTGMQMRPMAMTLADDQAIHDVVAYIQSLSN